MSKILDKYKELYKLLEDLQELQCLHGNQKLETIVSEEKVAELKDMGLYNPNQKPTISSAEAVREIQLDMYEVTSQLKTVYSLLNNEDIPEYIKFNIDNNQKKFDILHENLKKKINEERNPLGYLGI